MFTIVVRETTGKSQVAFVVECRVQSRVTARRGICGPCECVRPLEITSSPAASESRLERVIVRIGIISEQLHSAITVDTREGGTGNAVGYSARCNWDLRPVLGCDDDRVVCCSEPGLDVGASLAKMDRMGTDVAEFDDPLPPQIPLKS